MKSLPPGVRAYRRTEDFTQDTFPIGLQNRHTTKSGVWARICILEGEILYRILEPEVEEYILTSKREGIVEPEIPHEVDLRGDARFFVEFFKAYSRA